MKRVIANRYVLHEPLGEGGMGIVYRAYDRLNGHDIALKQVTVAVQASGNDNDTAIEQRVALAQEFRVLASLRHPHIISVLDYGFDTDRQPFFTMDLLEDASNLVVFSQTCTYRECLHLTYQMLQALRYLHRRGILHCDLKPDNVMVADGRLRLLDFGLALQQQQQLEQKAVGTLAYMSPEVLQHGHFSIASDLYAMGIMLYEMFAGTHPYRTGDVSQIFEDILNHDVDTDLLDVEPDLRQLISEMVQKNATERIADIDVVLSRLHQIMGDDAPPETPDVRDSFLQGAQFVGRKSELDTLTNALKNSLNEQGGAWLIGGESGSGKTRLVDELRIEAMVNGVRVLRGEGVTGGGLSFQLWRDLMRQMVLMNALTDLEASVLKELVPDIAKFIGRPVKAAPPLESIAAKQRLIQVVTELFQRQTQPILLILEDLHWLNESLDLIPALCDIAKTSSLMIIGTYRSEERPQLSQDLPEMTPMLLKQLSDDEIATLSSAMLGEAGTQGEILELLQRETGGNVFFLIETVRALADHAGDLDNIGLVTLPATVFSGGIAEIIRDRLHQLSDDDYRLLAFAALIGRVIDPDLLYHIADITQQELGGWLIRMGNAAVLTVEGETWRFAHDKLRQAVLDDLLPEARQQSHRQIAEAIERHYGHDDTYVDILLQHWHAAGDTTQERYYAHIAGRRAHDISAFEDAKRHFLRTIELLPETGEEVVAMLTHIYLGDVYELTGNYPLAIMHFWNGVDVALKLQDKKAISHALRGLGKSHWRQGDYDNGKIYLEEAVKYRPNGLTYVAVGDLAWSQGRLEDARIAYGECLRLTERSGDKNAQSQALQGLGVLASRQERYDEARNYIEHSIAIKDEIGFRGGIAGGLNSLGVIAYRQRDYLASRNYFNRSINLASEIGNVWVEINASCNLAFTWLATDHHDDALTALNRSLKLAIANNAQPVILELMVGYAHVMHLQGQSQDAITLLAQVAEHPAVNDFTLTIRIAPLKTLLNARLSPETFTATWETGKTRNFDDTLTALLAQFVDVPPAAATTG